MGKRTCILIILFALSTPFPRPALGTPSGGLVPGRSLAPELAAALYSGFEENRGQADAKALFLSRGRGYIALFDEEGVTIALPGRSKKKSAQGGQERTLNLVRMVFEGASHRGSPRGKTPLPRLKGLYRLPGRSNYLRGNDPSKWLASIPRYEKLDYEGVYPGASIIFGPAADTLKKHRAAFSEGDSGGNRGPALEYDIVLQPGADPGNIGLFFPGGRVSVSRDGDLVISAGAGRLFMPRPRIYQRGENGRKRLIDGGFVQIGKDRAGFEMAAYDKGRALVIDPTIAFSTFLGGGSADQAQGIAVDSSGGIYVTGFTLSPDFPVKNQARAFSGGAAFGDAFVTKLTLSPTPQIVYSTFIGGRSDDAGYAIAVDCCGQAYITGFTSSPDFPAVSPFQGGLSGGRDAFVTKLSADGTKILYSTFFGGGDNDEGRGIAVDEATNIYITGFTRSANFPLVNSVRKVPSGDDAFAAKILAGGSTLGYSVLLGGGADDDGAAIAVDASGNAFVTGSTGSTDFPVTVNAYQPALRGAQNAFLTKLDPNGNMLFSTFLGGSASDAAAAIALDSAGAAYITGSATSPDFPLIIAIQSLRGARNSFISKFSPSGGLLYSTFLGGSGQDLGGGIGVDAMGNAYIAGQTSSTDFPLKNAVQGLTPGENVFVSEIDSVGSALVFSTYLGGSGNDFGLAIAVDPSGSVFVAGGTTSPDFIAVNAVRSFGGATDAFATKIAPSPNSPPSAPALVSPSDGQLGVGSSVTFTWNKSTDPDGDPVTYEFFLCTNRDFNGCPPSPIVVKTAASKGKGALSANARAALSMLLFTTVFWGAKGRRKRLLLMLAAVIVLAPLALVSCGGGGPSPSSNVVQNTVSGLPHNTTFFWKVIALDGRGGSADSGTHSFKTG